MEQSTLTVHVKPQRCAQLEVVELLVLVATDLHELNMITVVYYIYC